MVFGTWACAAPMWHILGVQDMQNRGRSGHRQLEETEHAWLCNGEGRQPHNSRHNALGRLDRAVGESVGE